ncbi:MAG: hypothetical protein M0Z38_06740 [Deltaproteobacteria bacterium]|nr:hypothetical protein [Deltaproteobacteria bacterium]
MKSVASFVQSYWAGMAAAVYAATKTIRGAFSLLDQAATFEEQQESLDRLLAKYDQTTEGIVGNIQRQSHGLIGVKTIMDTLGESIKRNMDPRVLEKFAAGAVVMAKITGQSTAESFEQISEAVSKGTDRALKRIVGVADMKEIFGEGFEALSEEQKQAERLMLVLSRLEQKVKDFGKVTDSTDDHITRMRLKVEEFKRTVGQIEIKVFGSGIAALETVFGGLAQKAKEIRDEFGPTLEKMSGIMGGSMAASIKSIVKNIGQLLKDSGALGILWTGFTAALKVANLAIALIADWINYIKIGIYALGWMLDKAFIAPLRLLLSWGGTLAEKLGFKETAAGIREFVTWSAAGAEKLEQTLVDAAKAADLGESNWSKAIEANKKFLQIQTEGLKITKEQAKATKDLGKPPPAPALSADQRKALREFMDWYKAQSIQMSGELKALHGDEAAAFKTEYEKRIEEIRAKVMSLRQAGLVDEKGEVSGKLSAEGRRQVKDNLDKIQELRDLASKIYMAKTELWETQTNERIAELSLDSDEEIHRLKLDRIRLQYKDAQGLQEAYITEENRRFFAAVEARASELRKINEQTAGFYLTGYQKEAADLKAAYEDDLAAFREKVNQKKATWEQYDAFVTAREYRLNEDLKRIYGTSFEGLKDAVRDYIDASGNEYNRGRDFFDKSVGGMESAIGDFLFAASQGTFKVREMFQSMGLSILKAASEIIAKMIALRIVAGLGSIFTPGNSAAGAVGGFGPAGGGASVTAVAALGGIFQGGFQPAFAIPGGGSMPFRAFSSGGIVKRPTVGLVGEGGQNEAVVPLPDGKAIPVKMQGGDERTIVVRNEWTINTLDANGFDQLLASRKSTIDGMMADSLARAGLVRDAVRRYR